MPLQSIKIVPKIKARKRKRRKTAVQRKATGLQNEKRKSSGNSTRKKITQQKQHQYLLPYHSVTRQESVKLKIPNARNKIGNPVGN